MTYMNSYRYMDTRAVIENTSRVTSTVWIRKQPSNREIFYSLRRIGRHWHITAHKAESGVAAEDPRYLGWRDLKSWAVHMCIVDYLKQKPAEE